MSTAAPAIPANTDPITQPTPTPAVTGGTPAASGTFTQEQVDAIITERLARQQRTNDANKAKEKADLEAAKLAEQGEFKKLAETAQAEATTLKAQLAARDHADLQRVVASAHKLPESLASRLTGTTREELEADAKELAKLVAAPAAPATPGNRPNPRPQNTANSGPTTEEFLRSQGSYNAL